MNQIDQLFISQLKKKIPQNISTTEEIASLLGINYDAAYRRLKGKVGFSLSETILLSKKFDISLNELFEVGEKNTYLIQESKAVKNISDFNEYLKKIYSDISPLANREDSTIFFCARELPIFYFLHNPILVRFRAFLWLAILKVTNINKRIEFKDFLISDTIINNAKKTGNIYEEINVTELWSYGNINNFLKQILYFSKMRQIDKKNATAICEALFNELKKIENKTINGGQSQNRNYKLYSSDLVVMNNSILIKYKEKMNFAYPMSQLKYFYTNNQKVCEEQESYMDELTLHATCLTNTSSKEHAIFFNNKYDKINEVINFINGVEKKVLF